MLPKGREEKSLSGEVPARPDVKDRKGRQKAGRRDVLGWARGGQRSELELCSTGWEGGSCQHSCPLALSVSPLLWFEFFPLPALSMPSSHLHTPLDMTTVTGDGQSEGGSQAGAHFWREGDKLVSMS